MAKAGKTRKNSILIALGATMVIAFTGCATDAQPRQDTVSHSSATSTYVEDSMEQFIHIAQKSSETAAAASSAPSTGPSASSAPSPTPTPTRAPTNPEEVGNTSFDIPQKWTPATAPGSEKAFLVTTAPQQKTVSFTTVSPSENIIDTDFLQKISTGLTSDTQKNIAQIQTAVITPSEGLILFVHNNKVYHNWVISNLTGTYLVSLGPSYDDGKNGSVAPSASAASTPSANGIPASPTSTLPDNDYRSAETALEQTQTIVDDWLGI